MLQAIKSSPLIRSFREKQLFWYYVVAFFATLWCVLWYEPASEVGAASDRHIRVLGMALQLVGAWTVWHDLTSTAREYGQGPSFRKALDYVKSVFFKPAPVYASAGWTEQSDTFSATGAVSKPLDPQQPIDIRVAHLEVFVQDLMRDLSSLHAVMIQQKIELTADLKRSMDELRTESGRVEGQIKQAFVGNLNVLAFGVLCLVLGIVLTSIPAEIVDWSLRLTLWKDGLLRYTAG